MTGARSAFLAALLLFGCGSQTPAKSAKLVECKLEPAFASAPVFGPRDAGVADVSQPPVGHNAFALGRVGRFGQHFRLFFRSTEPNVCDLIATDARDAAIESCTWGGFAVRPKTIAPVPSEVEPLARALVTRATASCEGDHEMAIAWSGAYRTLAIYEVIPRAGGGGAGGILVLGADDALGKIVTVRESMTWDAGELSPPKDVRWLKVPFDDGHTLLTRAIAQAHSADAAGDGAKALVAAALEAARAM